MVPNRHNYAEGTKAGANPLSNTQEGVLMEPTQPQQIVSVVSAAIEELESPHLRYALLSGLITPIREQRAFWSRSGDAHGDLWVFFIIPRRKNVAIAYSDEGYGLLGDRWGLVFVDSAH